MTARRPPVLLGRAAERQALDRLLDDVRERPQRGPRRARRGGRRQDRAAASLRPPGVGLPRRAGRRRRVRDGAAVRGAAPAVRADARPARRAPGAAAGGARRRAGPRSGAAPDRFLVALAALSLLAEVAAERPLLCLVDDAQWLDAASAQVLGLRRAPAAGGVGGARVRRPRPGRRRELAGLPELRSGGWPTRTRARCSRRSSPAGSTSASAIGSSPRRAATRSPSWSCRAGLSRDASWPAASGCPRRGDLPGQIEERFLRRLRRAARRRPGGCCCWRRRSPSAIRCSSGARPSGLGDRPSALAPADEAGAAESGERVRFQHPLVRSAVYRSAPLEERRAVHAALAEVDRPERGRRTVARGICALAAAGPDEEVAAELERSAGRAQARGGLAAAAAFLERAVALTADPARRAERALAAAQASLQAGRVRRGLELLASRRGRRARRAPARPGRAAARARSRTRRTAAATRPRCCSSAARQLEPLDVALARETYLDAWGAALFAGRLAERRPPARRLPGRARGPAPRRRRAHATCCSTASRSCSSTGAAPPPGAARGRLGVRRRGCSVEDVLRWVLARRRPRRSCSWDHDSLARASRPASYSSCATRARSRSSPLAAQRAIGQADLARRRLRGGRRRCSRRPTSSPRPPGRSVAPYGALVLAASAAGRRRRAHADRRDDRARPCRAARASACSTPHWADAVLLNGLGRYDEASAAAQRELEDAPGAVRRRSAGRCASWSRRPRAGDSPRRRTTRSSGSSDHDARSRHRTGRSGSRRGRARC